MQDSKRLAFFVFAVGSSAEKFRSTVQHEPKVQLDIKNKKLSSFVFGGIDDVMDNVFVTQKQLANLLGISERQVQKLLAAGIITKPETSKKAGINAQTAIKEYYTFKFKKPESEKELRSVQAEHEEIKKQLSELKLKKMKHELHTAKDVEKCVTGMVVIFRNRVLALPVKIAAKIIGIDNVGEVAEIIDNDLRICLQELSAYDAKEFDGTEDTDGAEND